jgi:hypothetical protein
VGVAQLSACPRCGRTCAETFTSNWFPVYTCLECHEQYCDDCGGGTSCPECGSNDYGDYDKVYA